MKIRIGNLEFEGTVEELRNLMLQLDQLIAKANQIVEVATSTAPVTTTATATPTVEAV
jgi:hypothetical protein